MEKYIDTHAHYNHRRFPKIGSDGLNTVLEKQREKVEKIINIGTNTESNTSVLQFVSLYNSFYGMLGFFPTDVWELEPTLCKNAENNWLVFQKQLTNDKIVGIGEIGLDYNWNCVGKNCAGEDAQKIQQKWFRKQLDLAQELKLPVSIHSRDAEDDTLTIFDEYEFISGVIHCFSYGRSAARKALDKGLYLGIGGTSTYPSNKELREVIKIAPLDRILLETDAPYLSPQPVRRELNTSLNIQYVIENITELKNVSYDEVVRVTNENAKRLFKFVE